ncbi:GNAT family protein [Bacillus sp. NEB1478]|uniref:GNAT family N-acetyltransferase n=1 Tax=Bacillus sp. NEB1478 TaxID=3073816 RepID=UPI002872E346|nr:GNAT family protein [Bacillus sp. NEB1478]WNB90884.1 GNAT family protein [Bacillus sp. NEB1478]
MEKIMDLSEKLCAEHIYLRFLSKEDTESMLQLQLENRDFFEQFAPERDEEYYTLEEQQKRLETFKESAKKDNDYYFGLFLNESDELIGTINLFAIMRGSIQSAYVGYFLDKKHNGKGYMTEAVQLIVAYAFEELKLHRVEAGVMPHNLGSIRVLEKAGFEREGLNRKNVKINGKWEDHVHLAIVNPND